MKLAILIKRYVDYKKSLGMNFESNENCLHAFTRRMRKNISIDKITKKDVYNYLYNNKTVTSRWFIKYSVLNGFFCYAVNRGHIKNSPLPQTIPKRPPQFVPYIYSRDELKMIFKAALTYQKRRGIIDPHTVQVILFLLYGAGLRVSEALSLTLSDVDLSLAVITIHESKFYKTRLVPFNKQLRDVLMKYKNSRDNNGGLQDNDSFFVSNNGASIKIATLQNIFIQIRKQTGIKRSADASYQPRMHDLRHTFAVHRLIRWYQSNLDVQLLLPLLSVYMGHSSLAATSVYLTMTPELLNEAKSRFEQYAIGGFYE